MYNPFTQTGPTIDKEVKRLLSEMEHMNVESPEYAEAVKNLSVLAESKNLKTPNTVSAELIVTVVATLVNTLIVLNYEQLNVITSKAFNRPQIGKV